LFHCVCVRKVCDLQIQVSLKYMYVFYNNNNIIIIIVIIIVNGLYIGKAYNDINK